MADAVEAGGKKPPKIIDPFEAAAKRRGEPDKARSRNERIARLKANMYEISGDPRGSKPEDYLSEEDSATLSRFLDMAKELKWPDAEPIIHLRTSPAGRHAWESSMKVAKAGLTKTLFFPKTGETQRGYVFARLNVMPTQLVAVGEDRKLYSKRGPELIKSRGIGWGILPKPELLQDAIDPVTVLLDYEYLDPFKSLATILVSRIKPENLPNAESGQLPGA